MTTAELHKILDDENKKISLEEYQNVLYQLKNDTIACATREEFELQKQTPKYHWYYGETNAFEIALHLSEHINPNQIAIECLKEVVKKLYDEFESGTFITDEGKEYYGSYVKYCLILDFVIDKLKVLGLEGDDIFVDNILKELEEV